MRHIVRCLGLSLSLFVTQASSVLVLAAEPPAAQSGNPDPKVPPSEQYLALAKRCVEERVLTMPKSPVGKTLEEVESQGKTSKFERAVPAHAENDRQVPGVFEVWQRQDYTYGKVLKDMVFQDNSVGKVYPGALVWCGPLAGGRVELVQNPPGRARVKVTSPEAGFNLEHDGTFFDFSSSLTEAMKGKDAGAARINCSFKTGQSLHESLLRAGLSASGWGSRFAANIGTSKIKSRSYCVLSVDQTYFQLVAGEQTDKMRYFDEKALDANQALAQYVLSHMKNDGEIGYIRRVSYGRRLLVVLNSEASLEELNAAVSATVKGFGVGVDIALDAKTLEVWTKSEANGVLIGGPSVSKDDTDFFSVVTGNPRDFLKTAMRFLAGTTGPGVRLQDAVPIAFEVASCFDNSPVAVYETAEFAGEIFLKSYRMGGEVVVAAKPIDLNGSTDANREQGDWDVGSDDRTNVVVSYSLAIAPDNRNVDVTVDMLVREMSRDRRGNYSQRPNDTRIRTSRTFRVYSVTDADPNDRRTIASIRTADGQLNASFSQDFDGRVWGKKTFNNGAVGLLRGLDEVQGLQVEFDGSGNDKDRQILSGKFGPFTVVLNRERETD